MSLPQKRVQLHLGNSQHGRGVHGEPMPKEKLKAPFPAFGGKSRVAALVWDRIGDVDNFCEPFANSAAVLLARPHPPRIETLNDLDAYIANFWRSTQHAPDEVAEHADGPVNEADLHARHRWLVLSDHAAEFRRRMRQEPWYFDARVAGWWCWGACCWIGSGWCKEPESAEWDQTPKEASGLTGVCARGKAGPAGGSGNRSVILGGGEGQLGHGVHAKGQKRLRQKRPHGGNGHSGALPGVHRETESDGHRPQLADAFSSGRGVHNDNHLQEKRCQLHTGNSDSGRGVHGQGPGHEGTCAQRRAWLLDWFARLRDRLRTVRVCCGHWKRVCDSESVTTRLGVTGVFLDPPYPTHEADGTESRSSGLYATDGSASDLDALRDEVLAWCRERGAHPKMRIAVCGYDTDGYAALEALGWQCVAWRAAGGYGNRSEKGKANAGRERIYFSPFCRNEKGLFDDLERREREG